MMKPGAFIFFVDNAAGGFRELISSTARKYKFKNISTPLKHQPYINQCFNNLKFGYRSCYESKVAVQLLMKLDPANYVGEVNLTVNLSCNENFFSLPIQYRNKLYESPQFQNIRFGPQPIDNLMSRHETLESGSPSNWYGRNFLPSSEFSPKPCRPKGLTDSPENNYISFPSESFCSSNSHAPASQNLPIWDKNQIYDSEYENESFKHELSFNAHYSNKITSPLLNNAHTSSFWQKIHLPEVRAVNQISNALPTPVSPTTNISIINTTATHDSGYFDESFENELLWNSSEYNTSPHMRASQRRVKYRKPKRKSVYSFCENEQLSNSSINNLSQHSVLMSHNENFPVESTPYRKNLQEQNFRISFKGIDNNSLYNEDPMNAESPLHQSLSCNYRPLDTSIKRRRIVLMSQHKPYELRKHGTK